MADLIIITSHAIQYQAPLLQHLAQIEKLDIHVVFLEQPAISQPYWDTDFNRYVQWDIPLVSGYKWSFLPDGNLIDRFRIFTKLHREMGKPPIMLTSWGTPFQWLVWTWAIHFKIPILIGVETNKQSYLSSKRPVWRHLWLKHLVCSSVGLLYIGSRNKEFYTWMGASETQLFSYPYSVDNDRFLSTQKNFLASKRKDLKTIGLDPRLPTLLFCGKLIHKKRPDLLIRAVFESNLQEKVNLLFVGEGQLRSELEKNTSDLKLNNVAFLGFLNQLEMPKAYALGDVLCLLSGQPSETWGLVVNESLACGRPVIVSDACGCVPDLVEGKNTGWLVKANDLDGTSHAILTSYSQTAAWQRIGIQGQSIIQNNTFAKMAEGVATAINYCMK